MARALRIQYEGAFYHIAARGNERKRIFFSNSDYDKFKDYLREAQDKYGCLLHCYMLMPNHYHLLLETPNSDISRIMHYINGSYSNYINRRKKRSGHLFQGRFKAVLFDVDSYFLELTRYVHLNPVRARMVTKPEDYPYSSYRSYIFKKKEDIVHRDLLLGMISKSSRYPQKKYRNFVQQAIEEKLEDPLKKSYAGAILGRKGFIKKALSRLKDDVIQKKKTSHRRQLHVALAPEQVIDTIASNFKVSPEQVLSDSGEYRNIAIHLMKKWTAITNKEIGELFEGLGFSAVAQANSRFSRKLMNDKILWKRVREILDKLSHVKG